MKEMKPTIPSDAPFGTIMLSGPIEWTNITLRISGESLIPSSISTIIGIEPDFSHTKNEPILDKEGNIARRAKTGQWHLNHERTLTDEWNCNYAIMELMNKINVNDSIWKEIVNQYKVDIYVSLTMQEGRNKGFQLEPELMRNLGIKGISLGFDIYYN
jgi:hypothetical protein